MIIVQVKEGEQIERALKKFKRKFEKTGIVKELRSRQAFQKPSVTNRKKMMKAVYVQKLRSVEDWYPVRGHIGPRLYISRPLRREQPSWCGNASAFCCLWPQVQLYGQLWQPPDCLCWCRHCAIVHAGAGTRNYRTVLIIRDTQLIAN